MSESFAIPLARSADALTRRISLVFAALVLLMAGLTVYMLWQQSRLLDTLRVMAARDVRLVQVSTDLLEAAYGRHQALIQQVLTQDPFERDEARLRYDAWGHRVGKARRLLAQSELDEVGRANLARQSAMIPRIVELQERVADLAAAGKIEPAMAILDAELIQLDAAFDVLVQRLRQHERAKVTVYAREAQDVANRIYAVSLFLGAGVTALSIWLGVFVTRALAQRGRAISTQARELETAGQKLIHDATHDTLTGLANRRLFFQTLARTVALGPDPGVTVGVIYLDLDDFKPINDCFGHGAGDTLLCVVADRLRAQLRGFDTCARLGGDEFALLVTRPDEPALAAFGIALRYHVAQPVALPGGGTVTVGVSMGCAVFPRDGDTVDALVNHADAAMYRDKSARTSARRSAARRQATPEQPAGSTSVGAGRSNP